MFLYGIQCKPYNSTKAIEEAAKIWRIMDAFGARDEQFHPFWRNGCPVKTANKQVLCSVWVSGDKMLAVVVNLAGADVTTEIIVDGGFHTMRMAGEDGSLNAAGL